MQYQKSKGKYKTGAEQTRISKKSHFIYCFAKRIVLGVEILYMIKYLQNCKLMKFPHLLYKWNIPQGVLHFINREFSSLSQVRSF